MISLILNLNNIKRGPGIWKFNNSLLQDEQFVSKIIKTIKETIIRYAKYEVVFDENDTVVGNCEFSVNDQLFFETLIMLLRGECISYSSFKKKQTVNDEKNLERKIEILEQSVVTSNDKLSILKEIDDKKLQLESLRLKIYNGIITRSRIKWMEFGESHRDIF